MDKGILPVFARPASGFACYQKGSPYYEGLMEVCKNYHLKITEVDLETILSAPVEMFDPLIVECGDIRFFRHLLSVIAPRRVIFAHDIGESVLYMPRVSIVAADTAAIMERLIRYLFTVGRKKIALFAPKTTHFDSLMLTEIYKGILKREGYAFKEEDIFWDKGSLKDCFEAFMERVKDYNAVISTNIQSAAFLIAQAQREGIRVPEDLYVTSYGYQGMPLAKYCNGGITRVEFDGKLIGKEIANTYVHLKKKPHITTAHCLIKNRFVVGGNTGVEFNESATDFAKINHASFELDNDNFYNITNNLERMLRESDELDLKILQLMKQNQSIMDIADALFLSRRTVSYRLSRMLANSRTKSREELFNQMDFFDLLP